jgi:hypothetical protein
VVVEVTTEGSWVTTEGSWEPGSDGHGAFAERGRGLALMRGLTGEFQLLVDAGRVTIRLRPAEVR